MVPDEGAEGILQFRRMAAHHLEGSLGLADVVAAQGPAERQAGRPEARRSRRRADRLETGAEFAVDVEEVLPRGSSTHAAAVVRGVSALRHRAGRRAGS